LRRVLSNIEGNVFLIKKLLFLDSECGYNKSVGDRMLPEEEARKPEEGGHAGGPLFLCPVFKRLITISFSISK
jgi:hypothetical protein